MSTFAQAAAAAATLDPPVSSSTAKESAPESNGSHVDAPSTSSSLSGVKGPRPRIDTLILDAGALVMQAPLAGLATEYYIPPQVIQEIKHASGREYLSQLRLRPDFHLHIVQPSPASMLAVTNFAKKTGDIAVLSQQDLEVIALTYEKEVERHGTWNIRTEVGGKTGKELETPEQKRQRLQAVKQTAEQKKKEAAERKQRKLEQEAQSKQITVDQLVAQKKKEHSEKKAARKQARQAKKAAADHQETIKSEVGDRIEQEHQLEESSQQPPADHIDEDDEDLSDDDSNWITPENVQKAKNVSLGLVSDSQLPGWTQPKGAQSADDTESESEPEEALEEGWERVDPSKGKGKATSASHHSNHHAWDLGADSKKEERMTVACITGDFAVQNVLLQMGMSLIGVNGMRIHQIKSYVLRCHACMKICKDMEKKFCPSCGNATLNRVAVTIDDKANNGGGVQLHLKKNYQHNLRGTKYSIPAPKPGSASGGKTGGSGLILREDQVEWQRALAMQESRKRKEQRALEKAAAKGKDSLSVRYQEAWDTGDIFLTGDFTARNQSGMPEIGYGRRNPNANRRTRK